MDGFAVALTLVNQLIFLRALGAPFSGRETSASNFLLPIISADVNSSERFRKVVACNSRTGRKVRRALFGYP